MRYTRDQKRRLAQLSGANQPINTVALNYAVKLFANVLVSLIEENEDRNGEIDAIRKERSREHQRRGEDIDRMYNVK
jgi:hypothetical protein